jgi:hypothetical protein
LSQREVIGVDMHLQLYFFSGTGNARNSEESFIDQLEIVTKRILRPQKPGPKKGGRG